MFIGSPEGNYDRLLDFSTAKTGSLFFVPTLSFLDNVSSGLPAIKPNSNGSVVNGNSGSPSSSTDNSPGITSLKK